MLEFALGHPTWALQGVSLLVLASLIAVELVYDRLLHRELYEKKDSFCNLAMYAGSLAIGFFWASVVFSLYAWVHQFSPWKLGREWWLFEGDTRGWEWLLLLVLEDLTFYLFHRSSHAARVLWASHVNHHSSEKFNFTTALRQTWTPFSAVVFWLPLALIGFDPLMILTMQFLSLTYQSWLHTEAVAGLGPLEWVFNTPSHHRVHHGRTHPYLDKNFGGVLIIWDRAFGTFQSQEGPISYGLAGESVSRNPFQVAFQEWGRLLKELRTELRKTGSLLSAGRLLFGSPESGHGSN